MKRCPQCNRVEADDTFGFCRVDGTTLLRDSGSVGVGAKTIKFEGTADPGEIHTSLLPNANTGNALIRATAPTATLPATEEISEPPRVVSKSSWRLRIAMLLGLLLIGILSIYLYSRRTETKTNASPQIESVAVMPFLNASGNSDAEYLSDGITETLINNLSQLPNLSVKARSSVFRYKGKEADPRAVGSELSVQAILNGRVVQRGDDLTLYLSLVDTRTGNQIWGDQYNRKQADLISLQSEISRDVVNKLRAKR